MWMVKIPLIMYLFSTMLVFGGYYVDQASGLSLFNNATYDALNTLANKNEVDETISIDLIFGDFIAGVRVLFGIITGDVIADAFSMLPNFSEIWMIAVRLLFTLTSALLWIYVVAGRIL